MKKSTGADVAPKMQRSSSVKRHVSNITDNISLSVSVNQMWYVNMKYAVRWVSCFREINPHLQWFLHSFTCAGVAREVHQETKKLQTLTDNTSLLYNDLDCCYILRTLGKMIKQHPEMLSMLITCSHSYSL